MEDFATVCFCSSTLLARKSSFTSGLCYLHETNALSRCLTKNFLQETQYLVIARSPSEFQNGGDVVTDRVDISVLFI